MLIACIHYNQIDILMLFQTILVLRHCIYTSKPILWFLKYYIAKFKGRTLNINYIINCVIKILDIHIYPLPDPTWTPILLKRFGFNEDDKLFNGFNLVLVGFVSES